ncbi:sulfotransferase family 2 domain-containing protein [Sphingomonas prati]|uniref:Sulfotransferase family protein n=1 Tax=Sphingomonas prati TaxID=1843237 RepID=A0A7W9F2I0_9SPHN|nr:sulfotransferase family 2 domain-containing protein [Sphingomonas prati]MBB5730532.1 hypothetical protein [Sphingomonas prati]GGE94761.1 hypothetical protein GCM10011404_29820 [Sphingomonas prati]
MVQIVSPHIPKCGGTSLIDAVTSAIGPDLIYLDYGDSPANPATDFSIDPLGTAERFAADAATLLASKRLAYGHMHAAKYRLAAPNAAWVTILRDPVERLISHYFFWREAPVAQANPLRRYFHEQSLDLLGFARLPMVGGFYRDVFFRGLRRADFEFVGRTDAIEAFTVVLGQMLDVELLLPRSNVGGLRSGGDALEEIDRARPFLRDILKDEIAFYEEWTR